MMENNNSQQNNQSMILSGLCPIGHDTEEFVCKGCYEDLLKKYNKLKNNSGEKVKSPWQTW